MRIAPFRLERYFAAHEFTAPYLLCCSDCESMSTRELLDYEQGALESFLALRLGYTESPGSVELREAIADLYLNIAASQVLVHAGAEEAIFNFMNVALSPGDRIIVHSPFYQSLGEVARSIGAEVVEWRGDPGQAWALDLAVLKQLVTNKTKVVVVNVPHNPTGFLPPSDFMHELSRLSDRHGFLVCADEVYRGLEYEQTKRLPAFADINERGISLGVMSKTYGLAGLRIGWVATRNTALYHELASFKDYTTICSSGPSEFLAALALRHRHSIVSRNLEIIRTNLAQLTAFFGRYRDLFEWLAPLAGPIAFPRFTGGPVDRFCRDLVRQAGVLLLPGTLFDPGCDHFRIGFGRRNLPECLDRMEGHIKTLR